MKKRESEEILSKKDFFVPRELWEEYDLTKSMDSIFRPKKTSGWIYYGFWPLFMAVSFADKEPVIPKRSKFALWPTVYAWDRVVKKNDDEEKGWTKVGSNPRKRLGILEVRDGDYYKSWGDTTKNLRNRWLKVNGGAYEVVEVQREEFLVHYVKSKVYKKINKDVTSRVMRAITKRDESGTHKVYYLLVRNKESNEVKVGLAYESSSSSTNTYYSIGFLTDYGEKDPLMTGLLMEWIERERKSGYAYFNFGVFWKEGDPKSWQGFSKFKLKYGVKMYDLPQSLIKIKWFW